METPEQIAQWIIDNRYPKNEKEKLSDFEMFNKLIYHIKSLPSFWFNEFNRRHPDEVQEIINNLR